MYNRKPKRGDNGGEAIFEPVVAENFLKVMKDISPQIPKAQQIPRRLNIKKDMPDLTKQE